MIGRLVDDVMIFRIPARQPGMLGMDGVGWSKDTRIDSRLITFMASTIFTVTTLGMRVAPLASALRPAEAPQNHVVVHAHPTFS